MNREQAAHAWELSELDVRKICIAMGIDPDNIPDDTVPVYIPNPLFEEDPHRYYVYLMEVISNTHMEIQGIDKNILETCIEQLKDKKLIVLKRGADPNSLDYRDYVVSAERGLYNEWSGSFSQVSLSFLDKIISLFKK